MFITFPGEEIFLSLSSYFRPQQTENASGKMWLIPRVSLYIDRFVDGLVLWYASLFPSKNTISIFLILIPVYTAYTKGEYTGKEET